MIRFFKSILSICLVICLIIGFLFLWFRSYYCNPSGKDWYNYTAFPDINSPYNEIYDGSYSIKIEGDNVIFKPSNGEEVKGKITVTPEDEHYDSADITIEFENGITAHGYCVRRNDGRILSFDYAEEHYLFEGKRGTSKEEMLEYRAGLIEFLYSIYETGYFPTLEEIEANSLYKEYTNFRQTDPAHGGPKHCAVLSKVTIEEVDFENCLITVRNAEGETKQFRYDDETEVSYVSNGQIHKMSIEDLTVGDCLITDDGIDYSSTDDVIYFYKNLSIYYLEER